MKQMRSLTGIAGDFMLLSVSWPFSKLGWLLYGVCLNHRTDSCPID